MALIQAAIHVCVCVYVCIYIYIHIRVYIHIYIYIYTRMHVFTTLDPGSDTFQQMPCLQTQTTRDSTVSYCKSRRVNDTVYVPQTTTFPVLELHIDPRPQTPTPSIVVPFRGLYVESQIIQEGTTVHWSLRVLIRPVNLGLRP